MISREPKKYPLFKLAIFALLIVNTVMYFIFQTLSEGLDSSAWLVLLALFELETEFPQLLTAHPAKPAVHGTRLAAIALIAIANATYFIDGEWLDILNSALWLAVVVLLEFEIRFPQLVVSNTHWFKRTAAALYGGLALPIVVWMVHGEWLDAYDAVLWILAFAAIELDVLQVSGGSKKALPSPS